MYFVVRNEMSELRVMLLQLQMPHVNTASEKLSSIERICAIIKASPRADLYVLPELAPVGYTENAFAALEVLAEDEFSNDSMCRVKFASLARELQAFICYGVPGKLSQKVNITQWQTRNSFKKIEQHFVFEKFTA